MFAILLLACCLNAPTEVTVDSDTLTVGGILPIPVTDARASVPLGYAPTPGLARRIPRYEIVGRIQAAGLHVDGIDGIELPESILVHRRSEPVDPQLIRQTVLAAFSRQFPQDVKIDLLSVETPAIPVGSDEVALTATLPVRFDPGQPVFVRLDVRAGAISRTVFARTVVRIESVQPVLRSHIAANSEVHDDDVEWKMAPLQFSGQASGSSGGPSGGSAAKSLSGSLDGLQGMVAKRDLEPGQILKADLFFAPLYVRKGESVTVKSASRGVTVSATMRAMAAGRLGDTIAVQHLTGTGGATARVVGMRLLEVINGK